jgi:AcrR family transcriptional regulator
MRCFQGTTQVTTARRTNKPPPIPHSTRIVDAAITCLERDRADKITMSAIAAEAGLGRKTLYRVFDNRAKLLEAVALRRLEVIVEHLRVRLRACDTFETALVLGVTEPVHLARLDPVFMSTVGDSAAFTVEQFFVGPRSPIQQLQARMWSESFARARVRGEINPDLTDDDIMLWLSSVQMIVLLREDLDRASEAALLRKFVLPAISTAGVPLRAQ